MRMQLRFCESEINDLANRYTESQREENRMREQYLIDLRCDVLDRGYLTKQELHTIARWKSPRRAALTLENTDDFIKEITEEAFTSTDDWTNLLTLTRLQGIGQPTASAILHLYDEGQYPILDIRALWSVGLEWKKELPIRSGWTMSSFVGTLQTETGYACGHWIGRYGFIHITKVSRLRH